MTNGDSVVVEIQLTEEQRLAALRMSGTPGGDGSAIKMMVIPAAFFDFNINLGKGNSGIDVTEVADTVRPEIVVESVDPFSPGLNYNTGILSLLMTENMDVRAETVDFTKIIFSDRNDENRFNLAGSTVLRQCYSGATFGPGCRADAKTLAMQDEAEEAEIRRF